MTVPHPQDDVGADEPPVSLVRLGEVLLRARDLILLCALVLGAIVAALTLLRDRTYTATATLMPQARRPTQGGLQGIAAQFGLNMALGEATQSPAFYGDLLTSRALLGAVATTTFTFDTGTGRVSGTLVDIYRAKGRTPELRRDDAIRRLEDQVSASVTTRTGVITLAVRTIHPQLAVAINQRLLELLNDFNLRSRQSQAAAERRFTERRLEEIRRELRAAEDRLQEFMQRNRDFRGSPELTFREERLSREVSMQQQIFTTMAQAFEQAKVDEVRDTPVITIVVPPELPVRPDRRGLAVRTLLALLVGAGLGAGIAILRAYGANARGLDARSVEELDALRRETLGDLVRPWRPVRRLIGGRRG